MSYARTLRPPQVRRQPHRTPEHLLREFLRPQWHDAFARLGALTRAVVGWGMGTCFAAIITTRRWVFSPGGLGNLATVVVHGDGADLANSEALALKVALHGVCRGGRIDLSGRAGHREDVRNHG